MKRFATLVLALVLGATLSAADLSSDQKLKAKDVQIKGLTIQLQIDQLKQAEAQVQAAQQELEKEATALAEEFRKTLKANKDDVFNWQTMVFDKAPTPKADDKK